MPQYFWLLTKWQVDKKICFPEFMEIIEKHHMEKLWSKVVTAKLCNNQLPYFIEYNAHTILVCTWISQWFLEKYFFSLFKNNFTRINHCIFIHHKTHLKPLLSYLPCIVHREYFSIIFNVKKCALYSIKYGICFCVECNI